MKFCELKRGDKFVLDHEAGVVLVKTGLVPRPDRRQDGSTDPAELYWNAVESATGMHRFVRETTDTTKVRL